MVDQPTPTVYVETSVVSYLTARPATSLLAAAWQTATVEWWDAHRPRFNLCTSALTIEEAGRGNPEAAARRLEALSGLAMLPVTDAVATLADQLMRRGALPAGAQNDAVHIAVSAANGVDYLLTWNFRHLANAETKPLVRELCGATGLRESRDMHSERTDGRYRGCLTRSLRNCGGSKTASHGSKAMMCGGSSGIFKVRTPRTRPASPRRRGMGQAPPAPRTEHVNSEGDTETGLPPGLRCGVQCRHYRPFG